jgi:hypothetical protein
MLNRPTAENTDCWLMPKGSLDDGLQPILSAANRRITSMGLRLETSLGACSHIRHARRRPQKGKIPIRPEHHQQLANSERRSRSCPRRHPIGLNDEPQALLPPAASDSFRRSLRAQHFQVRHESILIVRGREQMALGRSRESRTSIGETVRLTPARVGGPRAPSIAALSRHAHCLSFKSICRRPNSTASME